MKVRLLQPWKFRKVGTILADVPDGTANMLIRRKFAEEMKPEQKPVVVKPERKVQRVGA